MKPLHAILEEVVSDYREIEAIFQKKYLKLMYNIYRLHVIYHRWQREVLFCVPYRYFFGFS